MTGSSGAAITVLNVDGSERGRRAAARIPAEDSSMTVESVGSVDAALGALAERAFGCVVSRYRLPDDDGLALLESRASRAYKKLPSGMDGYFYRRSNRPTATG